MLRQILIDALSRSRSVAETVTKRSLLNVGGGSKVIPIPQHYDGWGHFLLDIDARGEPDIVCDARNLHSLPAAQFDAVYCSHNLEHYYRHDGFSVLRGFRHVLKPDGFAEIRVPDLISVMKRVLVSNMDLEDALYQSAAGVISALDVIYGYASEIEKSGQDFYAHKTGFSPASLRHTLELAGFPAVYISENPEVFEVHALAFNSPPAAWQRDMFGIPDSAR
ncbi:MAG: methyltransferase domain-containing protein [Betaproteobacteria bacterium]|nr:methyltransferase domain-containing protein [Betaproteobacteria bacterium]